jgi:uncharacterized FlgJ-related protein
MLYRYDKNEIKFIKVPWILIILKTIGVSLIVITLFVINNSGVVKKDYSEAEIKLIMLKHNEFTKDKLIDKIQKLNFRFPHIVYAQAILETGNFTSAVFKENNNMFGMREAKVRITVSSGTNLNHAYYNNWEESLEDYAYYYSTYLSKIKTEEEFFTYLSQNYAESGDYVKNLKNVIEKNKLKTIFK